MPSQTQYERVALALLTQLGWHGVHLQTSSATSLAHFMRFARANTLSVAVTGNARSDHDDWGGWITNNAAHNLTYLTAVAAVNQHIASQAGALVGLSSSAWTGFVADAMDWEIAASLCCSCRPQDLFANASTTVPSNLGVFVVEANLSTTAALRAFSGSFQRARTLSATRYTSAAFSQAQGCTIVL